MLDILKLTTPIQIFHKRKTGKNPMTDRENREKTGNLKIGFRSPPWIYQRLWQYRVSQGFGLFSNVYILGTKRDIDLRFFSSYSLDVNNFFGILIVALGALLFSYDCYICRSRTAGSESCWAAQFFLCEDPVDAWFGESQLIFTSTQRLFRASAIGIKNAFFRRIRPTKASRHPWVWAPLLRKHAPRGQQSLMRR